MTAEFDKRDYLTAEQLAAATGVSTSTIWRLKLAGKIPYYQPGGDDHFVRFPPDAIEQRTDGQGNPHAVRSTNEREGEALAFQASAAGTRLPGRMPAWMKAKRSL